MKAYYGKEAAPPGSYDAPAAVGPQVSSTKASAPGIKIGTGLRALDYAVMRCGGARVRLSVWAVLLLWACAARFFSRCALRALFFG